MIFHLLQVREGRPDLRLFHQLYWIIVCSFLLVMYTVFPGAAIIQGTFPSETVAGRVCMLQSASSNGSALYESESYKLNMFRLFFPLLNIFIIIYLRFRVKRFMSELCPRKQMSCIGVYKRNVISLQMTICWLIIWDISSFLDFGLQNLMEVQAHSLSREVVFWIWNVKGFVFNEGLHFALPSILEVPNSFDKRMKKGKHAFYARTPGSLEPRRDETVEKQQKAKKQAKEKSSESSLLLSAKELLNRVPSRVIKVTEYNQSQSSLGKGTDEGGPEYRGEYLQNMSRINFEEKDKSSPNIKLDDERGKAGKLELSIPRTDDGHLRRRQPYTVYCRNHNSFARH